MGKDEFLKKIKAIMKQENIKIDEPMSKYTTFRIGGTADFLVTPLNSKELQQVIQLCEKESMPYYVIGNGSNLLVGDKGYRGVIIQLYKQMDRIEVEDSRIKAQAGALLSKTAGIALEHQLAGFEFAAGIPGTIGGAVAMNAGAYGGAIKDVILEATVWKPNGSIAVLNKEELELDYRTSIIAKSNYIVLEVMLQLEPGTSANIREKMEELKKRRIDKQPLEFPSAGSTFKRPEGYFAGKLIEDAGLRGFQVGGAAVSEKHCGFVINKGYATASDVVELMNHVIDQVESKFGIRLEPEVKKIGEF
ncbi:MAG: UDP-N-acetylmuramate dehydrogenase [Lachnospiraceae bacterium]